MNNKNKETHVFRKKSAKRAFQSAQNARFPDRIAGLAAKFGGVAAVARMAGASETAARKWKSGESEPGLSKLVSLARNAGVSLEWLATGQGPSHAVDANARARDLVLEAFHRFQSSLPEDTRDEAAVVLFVPAYNSGEIGKVPGVERVTVDQVRNWLRNPGAEEASSEYCLEPSRIDRDEIAKCIIQVGARVEGAFPVRTWAPWAADLIIQHLEGAGTADGQDERETG